MPHPIARDKGHDALQHMPYHMHNEPPSMSDLLQKPHTPHLP